MGEAFSPLPVETSVTLVRLPNGWYVLKGKLYSNFSQLESEIIPKDINVQYQINIRPSTLEERAYWMTRIAMGHAKPETVYRLPST